MFSIMGTKDARIDAYIAKAAPFAQPILNELRDIIHEGCPQVEETMKWSMPFFEYKGILCNMSAFKAHCAFGFWKSRQVFGEEGPTAPGEAMGHFGRLTTLKDLPPRRKLVGYVKKAAKLNDEGTPGPIQMRKLRAPKPELPVPEFFHAALKKNKKAKAAFDAFAPSHRRDYIEWLVEAKTEATRQRRLEIALEWIAEGKSRNWKYEKC
jgi:uncharacterized protein YdeI (YjbR/CyaY-like superfamily)